MSQFTRPLMCRMSDDEALERGKALAWARSKRNEAEENRKAAAKEAKEKVDALDDEVDRLSEIVRTGLEERPVECRAVLRLRRNEVEVIRLDTGEIVETRKATDADRQLSLIPEDEPDVWNPPAEEPKDEAKE